MPTYRLIFPVSAGYAIETQETAHFESAEELEVGAEIEFRGRRWRVSQAPLEQPAYGETVDLMVWPAE